jgi:hypothetical protein
MTSTMRFDKWENSLGTDALVASSSGYINQPNKPIISGQIGSSGSFTGPQLVPFDDFWVQRGITYNSSTRRFTVPVSGIYRIVMNPFFINTQVNSRMLIGVNNDSPNLTTHRGHAYRESGTYDTASLNSVVSLNANDYVCFYLYAGGIYNASVDRFNQFSIEMIA